MTIGAYSRQQRALRQAQEAWDNATDDEYESRMMIDNDDDGEEQPILGEG